MKHGPSPRIRLLNNASKDVVVFKLDTGGTPWLSLLNMVPTDGSGGASGYGGSVQFGEHFGAVVKYGSNSVSQPRRDGDFV